MPIVPAIPNQKYTATAGQTSFPYDWPILDASELEVYVADIQLALNIAYTVTGVGAPAGGSVILTTPALAGASVVLRGQVPLSQDLDYAEHTPFPAQAHEGALDKLTRITQQLKEELNRSVRQKPSTLRGPVQLPDPATLTPVQGGKKALVYNDAGTDLELLEVTTQIGSIVEIGLVDDTVPALAAAALPVPATVGRLRQVTSGAPAGLYHDTGIAWVGPTVYDPANKAGVDLSAKIAATLADMTAAGGVIDARSFRGTQAWNTQVELNRSVRLLLGPATCLVTAASAIHVTGAATLDIQGAGMWESMFVATTPALQVINFESNGHLYATNLYANDGGIAQLGGYFIRLFPPDGSTQHDISRCTAAGMYDTILIGKANLVHIRTCDFVNAVNVEIHGTYFGSAAFDAGTTYVTDCVLASSRTTSSYGIAWEDTSGLYVENCHILGYSVGVAAFAHQPHIYNEIMFYNNRIGLQGLASVVIERVTGTGGFAQCIIANNAFGSPHPTYVTAVQLGGVGGANDIYFSSVMNNRLTCQHTSPCTLLSINHAQDVYVAGNDFISAGPSNAAIGITAAVDLRIGRNKYSGFTPHATITTPPIAGVIIEPEQRPGVVSIDPGPVLPGTQIAVDVTIAGLRPGHGDRVVFERQTAVHGGLVFAGSAIGSDDSARLYLYNWTASTIDDGPQFWRYVWFDVVP